MKNILFNLINPVNLLKAYLFHRRNSSFDKSTSDLELQLYSQILKNDMLHYGYFEDPDIQPDTISIKQIEDAQMRYAEKIIEHITNQKDPILDVGCGMGGLSNILSQKSFIVESLTPNKSQKSHIDAKYKQLTCYQTKFEDFISDKKYGTVINSESLQYISLNKAFETAGKLILPGGRWIISDYFRSPDHGSIKSPHGLDAFLKCVKDFGWEVVYSKDITLNVLPMLKVVHMYAIRFALPAMHFAFQKLRYKKSWAYFLLNDIRAAIDKKVTKEIATIDPAKFIRERKYMLFILQRPLNAGSHA